MPSIKQSIRLAGTGFITLITLKKRSSGDAAGPNEAYLQVGDASHYANQQQGI